MHTCMHTYNYIQRRQTDGRTDGRMPTGWETKRKKDMHACVYVCVRTFLLCIFMCTDAWATCHHDFCCYLGFAALCNSKAIGELASVVSTAGYTTLRSTKLRTACAKLLSICRFTGQVWSPPRRRSLGSPLRCPRLLTGRRGFRDSNWNVWESHDLDNYCPNSVESVEVEWCL